MGIAPEFLVFVAVIAGTPGPLNLALLMTGLNGHARFGAGAVAGASVAYGLLFAAFSAVARQVAAMDPGLFRAMQVVAAGLLIWLAWRMLRARPRTADDVEAPGGAWRGAAAGFGIVAMGTKSIPSAISAGAIFCDGRLSPAEHAAGFGTTAFVLILVMCSLWLAAGLVLGQRVRSPRLLRGINLGGAACLAGMAGVMLM